MSFDLYFVPRPADDDWNHAMDQIEEACGDDCELTSDELDLWARIVDAVSSVLSDVEQFEGDRYRQLDDGVGMQLTMSPGELSINSPYWFEGDEAERVVEKLRQVSLAVEGATGLVAYDPQAEAAFLADGSTSAAATFNRVGVAMRDENTFHAECSSSLIRAFVIAGCTP